MRNLLNLTIPTLGHLKREFLASVPTNFEVRSSFRNHYTTLFSSNNPVSDSIHPTPGYATEA